MHVLLGLLFLLMLFMRFGPDIPFRRALNEQLVEKPLHWLTNQKRHNFLYIVILTAMLVGSGEMLLVMGPEFVMWYSAELALYLDALVVSCLLSTISGVKAAAQAVRVRLLRLPTGVLRLCRVAPRGRGIRSHRASIHADNDDECDGSPLLPLAA